MWVVVDTVTHKYEKANAAIEFIDDMFQHLNLSVDADIAVVALCGKHFILNFILVFLD